MTVEAAIEFGQAWIEAGWTWAPGQVAVFDLDQDGEEDDRVVVTRVFDTDLSGVWLDVRSVNGLTDRYHARASNFVPDPRDPGFLGHARAQVRASWGDAFSGTAESEESCSVAIKTDSALPAASIYMLGLSILIAPTLEEALLAARRAAP